MSWAMEIVQQGLMDFVRISFMVAGHTKFEPDRLFSHIAKAYTSSDVFTTQELATMMSPHAVALVDNGKLVCALREVLGNKYSKMPGIRDLTDFVIVQHLITGRAMIKGTTILLPGHISARNSQSFVRHSAYTDGNSGI